MNGIALHVGRGTRRGSLTVFPIWQERAEGRPVSIADDRLVRVSELAAPSVPFLAGRGHCHDGRPGARWRCAGRRSSAAWDRILESAAREAAGAQDVATYGYRAREFIGLVEQMKPSATGTIGVGRMLEAVNGPPALRGIHDGQRLLHASVINRQVVAA